MSVEITRSGSIATLTLNRPGRLNAVTDEMWHDLEVAVGEIGTSTADHVLVITGANGAFCAGSDVDGLLGSVAKLPERIRLMNRVLLGLYRLPIPTVCRVDGVAAGAGANLALLCDFVLAAPTARFSQLFIRRGLSIDSGASWLLPRLVGMRRATELALLGDTVDAAEALRLGLVSRIADDLDAEVVALATRLADLPAAALRGSKRLLREAWEQSLEQALEAETVNQVRVIAEPAAQHALATFHSRPR